MKREILYAGWIPGNKGDRRKWRQLGVGGPMYWRPDITYMGRGQSSICLI